MPRSVRFQVGVTFCSGRDFTHDHDSLAEATQEYSSMLAVAVEPSLLTVPGSKHVRMVTFLAFDEAGEVTQHVTTPVFECDDKSVA